MSRDDSNLNYNQQINTPRLPWRRGLTNNSTQTSSLSYKVPTSTKPVTVDDSATPTSNTLVFDCKHNYTQLAFFCYHASAVDNTTTAARLTAWSHINGAVPLWIPHVVLDITVTASSALNGESGAILAATEAFGDTYAKGTMQDDLMVPDDNIWSPGGTAANAGIGYVLVDTLGYELLQVEFDIGTASAANVCYRQF